MVFVECIVFLNQEIFMFDELSAHKTKSIRFNSIEAAATKIEAIINREVNGAAKHEMKTSVANSGNMYEILSENDNVKIVTTIMLVELLN